MTVVTLATWLSAMLGARFGWIVRYSWTPALVEANADWRGYDLSPYRDRCGFATMSPSNLGDIGWFQQDDGAWYGPCLAVDVSARRDFYANVYVRHEVAEVGPSIAAALGFRYGEEGTVYMGLCPPETKLEPAPYAPPLAFDFAAPEQAYSYYPYPAQEWPVNCQKEPHETHPRDERGGLPPD